MEKYQGVFIYSTFFIPSSHCMGIVEFPVGLKKWIQRLLIFPVHQPMLAYWCLVVVDIQKKEIVCYDSLYKENSACLEELKNYIIKINGENFTAKQNTNITYANQFL